MKRAKGQLGIWVLLFATGLVGCGTSTGVSEIAENDSGSQIDTSVEDTLVEAEPGDVGAEDVLVGCGPDEDKDTIPDEAEGRGLAKDTDGDGTPDYLDLDSDGDSIPDQVEGDIANAGCLTPQDSDGDKKPDFQDTDSDENGLADSKEVNWDGSSYDPAKGARDTDGDKYPDYADPDNDGDSLLDTTELDNGKPVDTDQDKVPDLDDVDSDNDKIADGHEGTLDFDSDGILNFRDLDSDADGVKDECEAGKGHTLGDVPLDTDSDGRYDFIDKDTDSDGIMDGDEDKNGNCAVDLADKETDRLYADSDSDGASDMVEVTLGSDPQDGLETPETLGQFYFLMPYKQKADPSQRIMPVDLALQKADLGFFVDTTGTMSEEIEELKKGLSSIIPEISARIPDVQMGVAGMEDYPVAPYGNAGQNQVFYLPTSKSQVAVPSSDILSAIGGLTLHDGGDEPEGQIVAMQRGLTNETLQWPGVLLAPDKVAFDRYGALGFRKNALSVVIAVSDAPFHNGRRAADSVAIHDAYSFNNQSPYKVPTVDSLVSSMQSTGAKFIGLASNDGIRSGDPYEDMAWIADQTGSLAMPKAFSGSTCNTGLGGNGLMTPDGPNGTCRLVFDIRKNGIGITERLVDAVRALVRSLVMDIRVQAISEEPGLGNGYVDSVESFVKTVELSPSGGDDPTEPSRPCVVVPIQKVLDGWTGPKGLQPGADTHWDTVLAAQASMKICFNVVVTDNVEVEQTDKVQVFRAVLQVRAKNGVNPIELDFGAPRNVLFLVPAKPQ